MTTINDCQILDLPKIGSERGNLTFIEGNNHVPFEIKRVYYLYDIPGGETRGGHAHREIDEFLVAVSGSFDVIVNDGSNERRFSLNQSYYGLHIPSMIWRELVNFSSGAVCLVLASAVYDESDYIRQWVEFESAKTTKQCK